jgi:hypothetical protein
LSPIVTFPDFAGVGAGVGVKDVATTGVLVTSALALPAGLVVVPHVTANTQTQETIARRRIAPRISSALAYRREMITRSVESFLSRLAAVVLVIVSAACAGPATITYSSAAPGASSVMTSFDQDATGAAPNGSEVFAGQWVVRAEADTPSKPNALCQTGSATFPAIALSATVFAEVAVTVKFKPISGREDQAAGIIFRVQDKDNYYILRANALEGNVNFYKYANGSRSDIKGGTAKVAAGQWQELRVEATADRLRGFLDGQLVVETSDATFKAGRVGLWTKADSVTCFDDLSVKPGG